MPSTPSPTSLVDVMERVVRRHAERPALGAKSAGRWSWTSYGELGREVDRLRAALGALGIGRGDRVALIANNRFEWVVVAFASYGLGAAIVPMVEAQPASEWEFIARDCGAIALVAASSSIAERCESFRARTSIRHIITLDGPRATPHSYRGLLANVGDRHVPPLFPPPEELCAILYTSGTMGEPKGTRLSHRAVTTNITAIQALLPLSSTDRAASCLPWAHAFGYTCELHGLLSVGAAIAIVDSPEKVFESLTEVEPTLLLGVPRLFHQLYERLSRLVRARPALIRVPFERAIEQHRTSPAGLGRLAHRLGLALADRLLFAPVRDRLGGRLRWTFSGGAALDREVAEFFDALGVPLYEGYGLTEAGPVVTTNHPGAKRLGSVGRPLPGISLRIDPIGEPSGHSSGAAAPPSAAARSTPSAPPEPLRCHARAHGGTIAGGANGRCGEIVVYGPSLMCGYQGRPEDDAAVFVTDATRADRGLRSGDLGYVDEEGFLYITGRIKEQYKLANGKYVAPGPLEEAIRRSALVRNAMVYGENRDYNVAVVVPDLDALSTWATDQGLSLESTAELLVSPNVLARVLEEIDTRCQPFRPFERVRNVALVEEDFTIENGMLTASLKIRRDTIRKRHGERLDALYRAP